MSQQTYPDVGAWQRIVSGTQASQQVYADVGAWQRQVGAALAVITGWEGDENTAIKRLQRQVTQVIPR
jgi:hypothetical protein